MQADATDFDLGQRYDAVISNGGVWYGVHDEGGGHGYCGHLPTEALVVSSLSRVAAHVKPGGMLILSLQDRHADKQMQLPDEVRYTQRITDKGGDRVAVILKEYIFERGGERIGYEALDLAYIDNDLFEGTLAEHGFGAPVATSDDRYVVFHHGG